MSSSEITAKISELIWLSSLSESSSAKSFFLKGLGKWTTTPRDFRSLKGEERFMEVELKLKRPMRILGIDVGNYWSAFITVWASRDLNTSHSLLSSKILLSRSDSVTGNASKGEGVFFFDGASFQSGSGDPLYDRIKIKVTQPYNIPTDRFGLSMFVVRGTHSSKSVLGEGASNSLGATEQRKAIVIENLIAKAGKHVLVEPSKKKYLRDLLPTSPESSLNWNILLRNFLNTVTTSPSSSPPSVLKQFLHRNPTISLTNGQRALAESQIYRHISSLSSPLRKKTVLNPIQDYSNNNHNKSRASEEVISISPTKTELHRSVRKVLKVSPVNSSPAELLKLFHKMNPNLVLSKREEERIKFDFIKYCSSPKRKRRSESVEIIHQVKKKSRPSYDHGNDFDPLILKTFSREELEHNKVLIQTRVYKKDKELPLEGDSVIFVNKGVPVTFYKTGNRIFMEIEKEFFRPEVKKEHIVSIFKDYTLDQINRTESKENEAELITIKDDLHLCPICNETEFKSVRELEVHSWSCTGPQFEEVSSFNSENNSPTPGPSGLQSSSCPICSKKFPMNALMEHVSQCEE